MFIHKSSSKISRKTTASTLLTNFCNFDLQIDFPGQISIQSLLIYTVSKISVTCYSKGNTVSFSHFYATFIAKRIAQLSFYFV